MSDPEVNAAIADIEWLRKAWKRYALLGSRVAKLRREESILSTDSVANMVERSVLEKEQATLKSLAENNAAHVLVAKEKL